MVLEQRPVHFKARRQYQFENRQGIMLVINSVAHPANLGLLADSEPPAQVPASQGDLATLIHVNADCLRRVYAKMERGSY